MLRILLVSVLSISPLFALANDHCEGDTAAKLACEAPRIKAFLRSWVKSWADGDVERYLDHYTTERSPRSGFTREEWESHRRARISPDQEIEIDLKLESMGLEDSGLFDVVFIQHYRSETYQDQTRKRLFLLPEGGEFRIFRELSLD